VDVLIAQNNAALSFANNLGRQNHWLAYGWWDEGQCRCHRREGHYQSGDLRRHQFKVGGGSYLSSHDPRWSWDSESDESRLLDVQWPQPSSKTERFTELPIDRYITIVEGTGKWK